MASKSQGYDQLGVMTTGYSLPGFLYGIFDLTIRRCLKKFGSFPLGEANGVGGRNETYLSFGRLSRSTSPSPTPVGIIFSVAAGLYELMAGILAVTPDSQKSGMRCP